MAKLTTPCWVSTRSRHFRKECLRRAGMGGEARGARNLDG